jgi:thiol-disulfide isomerase/thioredoxin
MKTGSTIAAVFAACLLLESTGISAPARAAGVDSIQNFTGGAGWLNGPPITPADLRGKVVLVDFWEYTCVNCLRTLPYLKAWYSRYHADGLEIIGVHSPEFGFSGDRQNVVTAAQRLGVTWPVVLDDDHTIWTRFNVQAWPTEDLFDQNGKLVELQQGEGNYQQTEAKIQALLKAKNSSLQLPAVMALLPQDSYDKPGAVCYPQTPEMFVGPWHGQMIANAGAFNDPAKDTIYQDPGSHTEGALYLQGYWHATQDLEGMVSGGSDGYLQLHYKAIQVLTIMKPESGGSGRVVVTQDGKPVAHADAGPDIRFDADGTSYVTVDAARAYELLDNVHFGQHELRLAPQHFGVGIYDFAFESCEVGSDK